MKTPYDAALRVADRKLDKIRAAIGKLVSELDRIDTAHVAAEAAMERECLLAAGDHLFSTERYFVRAREQRTALATQRAATHAKLETLRRDAVTSYGERQALDTAIERYRVAAEQAIAAADQAAIDDLTGARHRRPQRRNGRAATSAPSP